MKKIPFVFEIPIFYALFVAVNYFFAPESPVFFGIDPHPFWLGILLFAFRYGVGAGFFAGFVSAAIYLVGVWNYVERYLFDDITFYFLPVFFILFGTLTGIAPQFYRRKMAEGRDINKNLEEGVRSLTNDLQAMGEVNANLEKRIVSRMSTLVTLYEGARRLETVNFEELYPAVLKFISKTIEATEMSLYLKENDRLVLKHQIGNKEYHQRPQSFAPGEGLVGMAASSGKVVSIRDFLRTPQQQGLSVMGDSLLAGPLKLGEKGPVMGVVAVHNIPFLNLNSSTVNLLQFLLQWTSRSIERAHYVQDLMEGEIFDPVLQVYSHKYFINRLTQEFSRSKRYYLPLGLGLLKVDGLHSMEVGKKKIYLSVLSRLLKESCRDIDVIAHTPFHDVPFALLMVTMSESQASQTRDKIISLYSSLAKSEGEIFPEIKMGLGHFSPKLENEFQLMQLAANELHLKNFETTSINAV